MAIVLSIPGTWGITGSLPVAQTTASYNSKLRTRKKKKSGGNPEHLRGTCFTYAFSAEWNRKGIYKQLRRIRPSAWLPPPKYPFVLDGFCEGKPAIVTTQAVTDITTVTVTRQSLLRMCEANPAFGLDLASYVGDVLRLMCFDAENQSVSDVTTRLINFIFLYMKSEDYCQTQCIPMSYENLASAVNASRIQIARICSKMKRLGVIDVGRRCITIKNPNALYDFTK